MKGMSNPNFSTSISADKAASLKQWAIDLGNDVVDQGGGYRIKNFSTNVRPQGDDPDGPWTVICPPDEEPFIQKMLRECPDEPA